MAAPLRIKQSIETVKIGNTADEGGTRSHSITVGGEKAMAFLHSMGEIPHSPLTAFEIQDTEPKNWSPYLEEELSKVWDDPVKWANFLIEKKGAKLIFLRIMKPHPDYSGSYNEDVEKETLEGFKRILNEVKAPLIVTGCGIKETDKEILPKAAAVAKGENLLFGTVTDDNYRTLTKACIENDHSLITESPIDINLAKQANILVQDAGLPGDRIVMYATTGALGYGLEYAYSIMEKTRIVGLEGDKYMNKPQIALVGQEAWRAKEAGKSPEAAIMWETVTGQAYLQSGGDIIVIRHPESAQRLEEYVGRLMKQT